MVTPVTLSLIQEPDYGQVLDIYAPFIRDTAVSFEYTVPSLPAFTERIGRITSFYPWVVAREGDRIAGYAYGGPHRAREAYRWSAEVSVYLHPAFHHKGIGTRLYEALFGILRLQGIIHLYAGITLPNAASEALHARMGFRDIGVYSRIGFKAGAWHDVKWMGRTLCHPPAAPAPPVSFREVNGLETCLALPA